MRTFLSLFFLLFVLAAGFFLWLAFSFGGLPYYASMSAIATLAIASVTVVYLAQRITLRTLLKSIGIVAVACSLAAASHELYLIYIRSVPVIHEREVDLSAYAPFGKQSRTVKLENPSTLRLENDLPVMDGATALYPMYAAFAEAVYPQGEYPQDAGSIRCTKTIDAYRALADGTVDIIFVASPAAEQEAYAQSKGVEFVFHPIGKEAFVFFVHRKSKVENLSIEQLKSIYAGDISNWRTVGGSWSPIIAYQRPEGSGSQTALIKMMNGIKLNEPPIDRVPSGMGGMVHTVASYRNFHNALGFTFRLYATDMVRNDQIRLLQINGVYPDAASIQDGSYPLASEFYAVTNQHPSANTQKLVAWILSDQGQGIIEKTGYTPIRARAEERHMSDGL